MSLPFSAAVSTLAIATVNGVFERLRYEYLVEHSVDLPQKAEQSFD